VIERESVDGEIGTCLIEVSPYHRKRIASAPSVFSSLPRYSSRSSLSKYIEVIAGEISNQLINEDINQRVTRRITNPNLLVRIPC
jgi:hypothetical protein